MAAVSRLRLRKRLRARGAPSARLPRARGFAQLEMESRRRRIGFEESPPLAVSSVHPAALKRVTASSREPTPRHRCASAPQA
jgi:hypothetical protein